MRLRGSSRPLRDGAGAFCEEEEERAGMALLTTSGSSSDRGRVFDLNWRTERI